MSAEVNIRCPHCGYSKSMPADSIPAGVRQATCPSCRQKFTFCREETAGECAASVSKAPDTSAVVPPSVPAASTEGAASGKTCRLDFSFKGTAREYFGIWIVNTLLKLVTIGIYSAWAKVRSRRFFYGSTLLQGQAFEYTADPLALFKGWLIAAAALVFYAVAQRIHPLLSVCAGAVIFSIFPWLLVRSRIFNARNSTYRNIRFGFRENYREAYIVYAGLPLLSMLSLGLLFPYMLYRQKKFITENSCYGTTPFAFHATVKEFYVLALKVLLGFIGALIILSPLLAAIPGLFKSGFDPSKLGLLIFLPVAAFYLLYFLFMVYGQTAMANLCWNSTKLGSNCFESRLRVLKMAWLFITNALAIMFSLGLMMPWAMVRVTRYRFETLTLISDGSLEKVLADPAARKGVSATGEEIGDVFDMDIDIAL